MSSNSNILAPCEGCRFLKGLSCTRGPLNEADEVPDCYETLWDDRFKQFTSAMKQKIIDNLSEKGTCWTKTNTLWLENKILEGLRTENYVDVANYCFMLHDIQQSKKETTVP